MLDTLAVTLVQYAPQWEDVQFNLSHLNNMIEPLAGKSNLIVLPEMFATGFSMNTNKICGQATTVLQWMQRLSQTTGAIVAGSIAVLDGHNFNRFYWVMPDCSLGYYDKRHLFTMSDEPQHFAVGTQQKLFEWHGWNIKPIVCYDLRFPAWCRNNLTKPYDLLICSASWPSVRFDVWLTLLKARAIENQCYVVGVNRTGTDGKGIQYKGDSVIYSPKGETIGILSENEEVAITFELSLSALHDFRKKFPVLNDMDNISFGEGV